MYGHHLSSCRSHVRRHNQHRYSAPLNRWPSGATHLCSNSTSDGRALSLSNGSFRRRNCRRKRCRGFCNGVSVTVCCGMTTQGACMYRQCENRVTMRTNQNLFKNWLINRRKRSDSSREGAHAIGCRQSRQMSLAYFDLALTHARMSWEWRPKSSNFMEECMAIQLSPEEIQEQQSQSNSTKRVLLLNLKRFFMKQFQF